jgi:hypothetical protein
MERIYAYEEKRYTWEEFIISQKLKIKDKLAFMAGMEVLNQRKDKVLLNV